MVDDAEASLMSAYGAGQIFGVRTLVLVGVIPEVVKKRGGGGSAP